MSETYDFGGGPVPAHRHRNPDGSEGGWVANTAQVSGDAQVSGNARVFGNAQVSGDAQVCGNARVSGNAWVFGNAQVSGDAQVCGNARVFGTAKVFGNAHVSGDAQVFGNAWVFGNAAILSGFTRYGWTAHRIASGELVLVYGCESHTLAKWRKDLAEIVARHTQERDLYSRIITTICDLAEISIPANREATR